jgi:hypothetical protein
LYDEIPIDWKEEAELDHFITNILPDTEKAVT